MGAELVRAPKRDDWYEDRDNLADLVAYLRGVEPDADVEYLLRKPWKWAGAYDEMRRFEAQERLLDEQDAFDSDLARRGAL